MTINQAIAMLQEAVACNPEAGEMILFSQVESQYGYSYYNECEALYDCTGDVYRGSGQDMREVKDAEGFYFS